MTCLHLHDLHGRGRTLTTFSLEKGSVFWRALVDWSQLNHGDRRRQVSQRTTPGLGKDTMFLLGRPDVTSPAVSTWRVRAWVLPNGSAARRARTLIRELLTESGVADSAVADAETMVAELAANAEVHARPPCELRVVMIGRQPIWCEVVDADSNLAAVAKHLHSGAVEAMAERGRGLPLVAMLSGGRCAVYSVTAMTNDVIGKAVGFALPGLR